MIPATRTGNAASAEKGGSGHGELCVHAAVHKEDEEARVHVAKRTGARAGQARIGDRGGHSGARDEGAVRLARWRATETEAGGRGEGGGGTAASASGPGQEGEAPITNTPPSPTRTQHRTYLSQRNRSSIHAGSSRTFHTTGRGEARPTGRRSRTGAPWLQQGRGGCRDRSELKEQNRTCNRVYPIIPYINRI